MPNACSLWNARFGETLVQLLVISVNFTETILPGGIIPITIILHRSKVSWQEASSSWLPEVYLDWTQELNCQTQATENLGNLT